MWQSADLSLTVDHGLWWYFNWKDWTEAVPEIRSPDRTMASVAWLTRGGGGGGGAPRCCLGGFFFFFF